MNRVTDEYEIKEMSILNYIAYILQFKFHIYLILYKHKISTFQPLSLYITSIYHCDVWH